jgi:hypothetical protein
MNPTDLSQQITLPSGRVITAITPGGALLRSRNARLNEAAFRRFERHIALGIANWPKETAFAIPSGLSPNTFEHRFRDALQALKLFKYDETMYNQLLDIRDEVCISLDPDGSQVWFRAKRKQGRPVEIHTGKELHRPAFANLNRPIEPSPTEETLIGFLSVARTYPMSFRGRIDPSITSRLEAQYDTAFAYDDGRDVTTML